MRSAMVYLGVGLVMVSLAGCSGRGRRNLTLTPKQKEKQVEQTDLLFAQATAKIPLSFPDSAPEIKQINLRGLICQDVTNPVEQAYNAKTTRQGELQVALSARADATSITCSSLAIETDQNEVYSGVIPASSIAKNEAGEFVFPTVLLRAGMVADKAADKPSDETITVDGSIKDCEPGQKFDVKTKQCK